MRFSVLILGVLVSMAIGRADTIGDLVDVTPFSTWTQVAPTDDGSTPPLPTVKYVPKDGRNAAVMLTLFPSAAVKVNDVASLKTFLRAACRPFMDSPNAAFTPVEFKARGGPGWYASFADPSLIGKPTKKGDYKVATEAAVLLSGGVTIQATLFTDATDSGEFREGLQIVQSVSARAAVPRRVISLGAIVREGRVQVTRSDLHTVLRLPAGFTKANEKLNRDPGYFSYEDEKHDGMMFSGWLEPKAEFDGDMRKFWAGERKGLTRGGFTIKDETFKEVAGWAVVTYTVPMMPGANQKNLRACKIVGDTWADVHLSVSTPDSTWKQLEDALAATTFETP